MNFLDIISTGKLELVLAGLAGSIVNSVADWTGWVPTVRKMIVGTLAATYLSPVAEPIIKSALGVINSVPEHGAAGVSGFIVGMCGIMITEMIMDTVRFHRERRRGSS